MQGVLFWLIYPLLWAISKLPFAALYTFSDGICFLVYRVIGYRKSTVRHNLLLAFPNKTDQDRLQIERKFYSHLCDIFMEMIKSISIAESEMRERFVFENIEVAKRFEQNDISVLLILGHYASYEWMNSLQFYMKNTGFGIYKKIKNTRFDRLAHDIRERWNNSLIQNKMAPKTIANHQKQGIVANYMFVADQSPKSSRNNHFSTFFNLQVPFFTGVERLAKNLDLPLVFVNVEKKKRGFYRATFEVLTDNPNSIPNYQLTDLFAARLEAQIKTAPEFYLWTHKRFKHVKM